MDDLKFFVELDVEVFSSGLINLVEAILARPHGRG